MKYTPKQRAEVERHVQKWRGLLMLNGHEIEIRFSATADPDDNPRDGATAAAEMFVNSGYMSGHTLTIFPRFFGTVDVAKRERKVAHELVHIITDDMRDLIKALRTDEQAVTIRQLVRATEHTTDWIANIVFALARR